MTMIGKFPNGTLYPESFMSEDNILGFGTDDVFWPWDRFNGGIGRGEERWEFSGGVDAG